MSERQIKIDMLKTTITFVNRGICYYQLGVPKEILDLIIDIQLENEQLENKLNQIKEYVNKYESIRAYYEYIDIDDYSEYNYDENFKEELLEIVGDNQ